MVAKKLPVAQGKKDKVRASRLEMTQRSQKSTVLISTPNHTLAYF